MTPLLAALSSCRHAARSATPVSSMFPDSAASRNLRMDVFSEDLTALLRSLAFSFCLLRLIWDLIFATRKPRSRSVRAGRADQADETDNDVHVPGKGYATGVPGLRQRTIAEVGTYPQTRPALPGTRGEPDDARGGAGTLACDHVTHARACPHRSRGDSQFLHHRAHRSRQVHPR